MFFLFKTECYTCDCYLNGKIVHPYYFNKTNNTLEKDVLSKKCNKCNNICNPSSIPKTLEGIPMLDIETNVYGFCNTCMCFVEEHEVYECFIKKIYQIQKRPFNLPGHYLSCDKCYPKKDENKIK